jgi:uncharacterized protein YbaP (TraB family)
MKRLAVAAFALFVGLAPARAEAPPACTGIDLLEQLKTERPADYEAVMADARAVPNGESIFWRIEREGVEPSFLLGTAHVTDPRVTEIAPSIKNALWGADVVALELKELRNKQEFALSAMAQAKLMVLPPGQSLWDLIPDADEPLVRGNVNLPKNAAQSIFGYQPWVVAAMLTIPPCEQAREQAGLPPLDMMIAAEATKFDTPLVGLETVEEQLSVFAAMPLDLQVKYLLAVAKLGARTQDYFETLISLYDQRLITAYIPLTLRLEPADADSEKMMAFVEQDLTIKRNRTMLRRAEELLAKGNAFIAVGALHLPGDEGLVELIRGAGYKVVPSQ